MIADMAQLHPHPVTGDLFESPVLPGSGWPGDLATTRTLVAKSSAEVLELAQVETRDELDARISVCRACPRLVEWREEVALSKRASFAEQPYWGRPVPGWGLPSPRSSYLDWLQRPTAPTAPGGCSPGIPQETGSTRLCTDVTSRVGPRHNRLVMGRASLTRQSSPVSSAHPGQQANHH